MYYTREYIIWFPFYLLWRPLTYDALGIDRAGTPLVSLKRQAVSMW